MQFEYYITFVALAAILAIACHFLKEFRVGSIQINLEHFTRYSLMYIVVSTIFKILLVFGHMIESFGVQ